MADISQRALQTWYGNASWAEHNPMELGTYKGRISFNSLSNGNPITSLSLSINKTNTGGGGNFTFYATQNASIVGNTITSATLVGTLSFGSGAGTKTFTFTQAMMDIVKQYTGLWYLLIDSSVYITFTGGSGTSGP